MNERRLDGGVFYWYGYPCLAGGSAAIALSGDASPTVSQRRRISSAMRHPVLAWPPDQFDEMSGQKILLALFIRLL